MSEGHILKIANELDLKSFQVEATSRLLDDGATIPFIARYRKEATGLLDEVQITNIRDRFSQLRELDKRRESILKSLEERELLSWRPIPWRSLKIFIYLLSPSDELGRP